MSFFTGRVFYDDGRDFIDFHRLFIDPGVIRFHAVTSWEGVHRVAEIPDGVARFSDNAYVTQRRPYLDGVGVPTKSRRCQVTIRILSLTDDELEIEGAWHEGEEFTFYGTSKKIDPTEDFW
jgi:hypothetical protein